MSVKNKKQVYVGQKMWVLNLNDRTLQSKPTEDKVYEVVVVKVGRKYITVVESKYLDGYKSSPNIYSFAKEQFDIETFSEVSEYSSNNLLFFTKEEAIQYEELKNMLIEIRQHISYGRDNRFNYAQINAVHNLLFSEEDIIHKISSLASNADANSKKAAAGYDEGWYNGEANAYDTVLSILRN